MKHFSILGGRACVVELPEKAHGFKITEKGNLTYFNYDELKGSYPSVHALPPGNWRIIGMLPEVTEDQAAGMVDSDDQYGVTMYRNYTTTGMPYFDEQITAIEALESAIVAEGYTFQSTPKPENKDFYWGYLEDLAKWEAAQSRVLSRERCMLLRRES